MILARARRHVDRECSRADHDLIASTNSRAGAARIFDHRRNKAQLLAGQALARNAVMPPRIELLRRPCWNDVHTRGPLTLLPFDTCFECSYFISHYDTPRMSGKP